MHYQNYKMSEPGCSMRTSVQNFFKYYAVFNGRSSRSEYWYVVLFQLLIAIPIVPLFLISVLNAHPELGVGNYHYTFYILAILLGAGLFAWNCILFLPSIAIVIRRLHDSGKSGWLYLLQFIPLGVLIIFVFMLFETEPFVNEYGAVKGRNYPNKFNRTTYENVKSQSDSAFSQTHTDANLNVAAELERYGRLLNQGLLSQEEFNEIKKRLLNL